MQGKRAKLHTILQSCLWLQPICDSVINSNNNPLKGWSCFFLPILHIAPLAFHTESFQEGSLLICLFSFGILPTAMYHSLWKSFSYGNAGFKTECRIQYQAHQFLRFVPPPFRHLQMGKQGGTED